MDAYSKKYRLHILAGPYLALILGCEVVIFATSKERENSLLSQRGQVHGRGRWRDARSAAKGRAENDRGTLEGSVIGGRASKRVRARALARRAAILRPSAKLWFSPRGVK